MTQRMSEMANAKMRQGKEWTMQKAQELKEYAKEELNEHQRQVYENKQKYKNRRLMDALSGHSIYSEDFYNFMKRNGHGNAYEQCQDAIRKNQNPNIKSTMREFWNVFESKVETTQLYNKHHYRTNIAKLNLELVRIYGLKRRCCPQIKLGIGDDLYCTNIGPAFRDVIEYGYIFEFDVYDISKEQLYFQLLDYDTNGHSEVLDWVKLDLVTLEDMDDMDMERDIHMSNDAVICIRLKMDQQKAFYYRDQAEKEKK